MAAPSTVLSLDPTIQDPSQSYPDSVVFGVDTGRLETVQEENEGDSSHGSPPTEQRYASEVPEAEWYPKERLPNGVAKSADETGWIRRKRRGQIPDHRATSGERVTALETAFTGFAQRTTDAVVTAPGCCAELLPVVRGGEGEGGWL
ncbi:uncharacterized protein [Lolium perenne]|uniref:uncharacterized protein n=1 Tax=Lolium perenne TaxID=4522 RepID=UPI0021F68E44|nr:uncharacterized protein LOC127316567 isoform X2 [Lolium perenne]